MTNLDKIRQMSAEELVKMFDGAWGCYRCSYNEGGACGRLGDNQCTDGIIKWLNSEHENPMPEIKVGDYIVYKKDSVLWRAVCVYGNIVYRIDRGGCYDYGGEMQEKTISIKRYSILTGTLEDIWRADNGN